MKKIRLLFSYLLICMMLLAAFPVTVLATDGEDAVYLTWDEYKEAEGVTSWNYNDMAQVIAQVAEHAYNLYVAGQGDEAYEYA